MRSLLLRSASALVIALGATAPLAAQNFDDFVAIPRGTVALTNAKVINSARSRCSIPRVCRPTGQSPLRPQASATATYGEASRTPRAGR